MIYLLHKWNIDISMAFFEPQCVKKIDEQNKNLYQLERLAAIRNMLRVAAGETAVPGAKCPVASGCPHIIPAFGTDMRGADQFRHRGLSEGSSWVNFL